MAERVGHGGAEQRSIDHHHRAGDAGHAATHQCEKFAARHFQKIGPHQQRRFDHAAENMHGGAEA